VCVRVRVCACVCVCVYLQPLRTCCNSHKDVLQCAAVCCSVLQCMAVSAVCCSVLQGFATCFGVLYWTLTEIVGERDAQRDHLKLWEKLTPFQNMRWFKVAM